MLNEGRDAVPAIADEAWDAARLLATQKMLRHPIYTPRPEAPEPWLWAANSFGWSFLHNCRDENAVRDAIVSGRMRPHLDAINYLQGTAYRVDEYILDFLQTLARWSEPPQLKPLLKLTRSHRDRGPRRVFEWDLEQADFLRNEIFYIPLSCEWRGRVRPIPYLNYLRGDHIRSVFRFAHGEPIGERGIRWLKISTANCFGGEIARKTFDERVAWVDEKMPRIRKLVENPFSGLRWADKKPWLQQASDPFQFLSHAKELVACNNNPEFITTLPLPFDASNSGAQHCSLLARDPVGARLSNLIDDGKPNDLYTAVADAVWNRLNTIVAMGKERCGDEAVRRAMWWRGRERHIGRKGMKSLVMTFLYGQSGPGQQVDFFDTLSEDEHELLVNDIVWDELEGWTVKRRRPTRDDIPTGHIKWLTEIVREEIERALPGVVEIMNFVRGTADALGALKGRALQWSSPTGVPIYNQYLKPDIRTRRTYLGATLRRHIVADGWLPELKKDQCKLSSAPNLIHSLDASHLALVTLACEAERIPLVTVHDCFGTLGCYTDKVREIWLSELRALYENENVLQELYDDARAKLGPGAPLPAVPERGNLNLEDVSGPYALA
jgi:DNA-directed RNA polymerase, mitochondrial